ncbi:polysaccharide biosynthesis protein [Lactiplantibacillus garii]|uniref:Polysaccharide biosynthesis protein n=1 Tax=Lactiplantibacillus garii TaxID=2306423 RepID=A0A3R8LII1_9LACO|nr:polysaccharide biosynthesis protein [Lactiplantibacillus garii]RRK09476.1 polysaccharide biosynthesis protein [Lactiplantibacillus garii]
MNEKQFYHVQRSVMFLAVILIVFGYTGPNGVFEFLNQPVGVFFYPQLIIAIVTTAGANLLMMALGAQQLRQKPRTVVQLTRLWGLIIVGIALFSFVFYLEEVVITKVSPRFSLAHYFAALAQAPDSFYDVLYEILGFFVTLPLLRLIAKSAKELEIRYLFWTQLIFMGILPILMFYTGLATIKINPPLAITNGCYFALMGYWLTQKDWVRRITHEQLLVGWLLTVCCYAVMISTTMYQANLQQNYALIGNLSFSQTLQGIPCLTVWMTIATKVLNRQELQLPRFHSLLEGSYAVILIAGILLTPLQFIFNLLKSFVGIWWGGLIWVTITLIISSLIVRGLRLIPLVNRLLPDLFYGLKT